MTAIASNVNATYYIDPWESISPESHRAELCHSPAIDVAGNIQPLNDVSLFGKTNAPVITNLKSGAPHSAPSITASTM